MMYAEFVRGMDGCMDGAQQGSDQRSSTRPASTPRALLSICLLFLLDPRVTYKTGDHKRSTELILFIFVLRLSVVDGASSIWWCWWWIKSEKTRQRTNNRKQKATKGNLLSHLWQFRLPIPCLVFCLMNVCLSFYLEEQPAPAAEWSAPSRSPPPPTLVDRLMLMWCFSGNKVFLWITPPTDGWRESLF